MTNRKSRSTDIDDQGRWISSAVQEYEGALVRYATQITGDLDRGRDVVQDTFLRLCKQDPQELDGRLAQWLFAVCRNRALDIRRKEDRMKSMTSCGGLKGMRYLKSCIVAKRSKISFPSLDW